MTQIFLSDYIAEKLAQYSYQHTFLATSGGTLRY